MSKMLSTLALSLLLGSASAYATDKHEAEEFKSALDSAKSSLETLKEKRLASPGVAFKLSLIQDGEITAQMTILEPGSTGNLYDRNILEKQLPYIEGYINLAASQLGDAAEKLPAWEGVNLVNKGCANVRRAHRNLTVALDKSKRSAVFLKDDFVDLELDIANALSENNCP